MGIIVPEIGKIVNFHKLILRHDGMKWKPHSGLFALFDRTIRIYREALVKFIERACFLGESSLTVSDFV